MGQSLPAIGMGQITSQPNRETRDVPPNLGVEPAIPGGIEAYNNTRETSRVLPAVVTPRPSSGSDIPNNLSVNRINSKGNASQSQPQVPNQIMPNVTASPVSPVSPSGSKQPYQFGGQPMMPQQPYMQQPYMQQPYMQQPYMQQPYMQQPFGGMPMVNRYPVGGSNIQNYNTLADFAYANRPREPREPSIGQPRAYQDQFGMGYIR